MAVPDTHPWSDRFDFSGTDVGGLIWIGPASRTIYNSGFPYGHNDGSLWAGRGLTISMSAGVAMSRGPFSLIIAPEAFWAENADFELRNNGFSGDHRFASGTFSDRIDLPQRFGDAAYARIGPGESTLRVDLPWLAAGISTAAQHWGPAEEHPAVLGTNAGGFPHLFVGTPGTVRVGGFGVNGRVVWGRLSDSEFVTADLPSNDRFMAGAVAAIQPWIPGLEIGFARFFHSFWPAEGIDASMLMAPFERVLKSERTTDRDDNDDASNQLVSVFMRWAPPGTGFEVYGEFAREDHSWNVRDFLLEPEHQGFYVVGAARGFELPGGRMIVARGEFLNSQISALSQVRNQSRPYTHFTVRQGHTHRGQALGSAAVFGGGGLATILDYYYAQGRLSLTGSRLVRDHRAPVQSRGQDVIHGIGLDGILFRGPLELSAGAAFLYNLNRDFMRDASNVNVQLGVQWRH